MIPISAITEWREYAPWGSSAQVEHVAWGVLERTR